MKEPVDHIMRPQLPWRDGPAITECGYSGEKVKSLTREEFFVRVKEMGTQRAALFTCMTCAQTAGRWGTWDDDPRRALEREIQWEAGWSRQDRGNQLRDELVAIAELIASHSEEFTAKIEAIQRQREWVAQKSALKSKTAALKPNRGSTL